MEDTVFHSLNATLPSWEVRRNASLGVSYNSHYANIQNATRTCIIPALCIFGIIGNIVNLIVLTRVRFYKLESTSDRGANIGLAMLAVSDMLLCLTVFPSVFTNQNFAVFRQKSVMLYYQAYGTGVVTTFILTSTWITLTLAVMRYFIICHPFSTVSFYNQKTIRSIYCGVCTLAVIINFPTFFHFKISEIGYVDNSTLYFIDIGIMDGKTAFSQAFQWLRFTVFIALPALILVYCNCSLVWALHASRKLRQQCVAVKEPIQRQNRVTLLLIIIAFGFIILVFPSELMDFFMDIIKMDPSRTEMFLLVRVFTNTLQMINFSCNFLLYCALNVHFRKVVMDILCCKLTQQGSQSRNSHEMVEFDRTPITHVKGVTVVTNVH